MSALAVKQKPVEAAPKAKAATSLQVLLQIEGEALAAKDHLALKHIAVNRPKALLGCGHILWVRLAGRKVHLEAISGQDKFDKHTPFAHWLSGHLNGRAKQGLFNAQYDFKLQSRRTDEK